MNEADKQAQLAEEFKRIQEQIPDHKLSPSGLGWVCTCGVFGWNETGAVEHLAKHLFRVENAVDSAWERFVP